MEPSFKLTVCPKKRRPFKIDIDYTEETVTSDVLETVEDIYCEIDKSEPNRRWMLYENWMGIERRLPDGNIAQFLSQWKDEESQVRYVARERRVRQQPKAVVTRDKNNNEIHQLYEELCGHQRKIRELRMMKVRKKMSQLMNDSDPVQKGLHMISQLNKKLEDLKMEKKKLSSEVSELNHEATRLTEHLTALRRDSEQVVDLLTQLKAENQVKREEEERRRKEGLKVVNKKTVQVQQELEKRQRMTELQDSKIQTVQTDIDHLRTTFKSKQRELGQLKEWAKEKRQRESKMKFDTPLSHYIPQGFTGSQIGRDNEPVLIRHIRDESFNCDSQASFESTSSYGSTPGRRSAASIRRRFADFEDRTKLLLEEESKTFRKAKPINEQPKHVIVPPSPLIPFEDTDGATSMNHPVNRPLTLSLSQVSDTDTNYSPALISPLSSVHTPLTLPTDSSAILTAPVYPPYSFYGGKQSLAISGHSDLVSSHSISLTNLERHNSIKYKGILKRRRKTSSSTKGKIRKGIRFSPEAILLNAAWEGELDLLKHCIEELGNYRVVSSLGVTCLHNAVCSGNLEMIDYCLTQVNCDVNVQDYKGWTPLHCAAAYCTFGPIQLLIKNGASIFMTTSENMTPADIAKEEMSGSNEEGRLCYQYLQEYENKLGIANDGVVYGLFSYTSADYWQRSGQRSSGGHYTSSNEPKEMSIIKGESLNVTHKGDNGWWEVEDMQGAKGIVPSLYLGLYPPYQLVL